MIKDISILVGKSKVSGILDAESDSLTVLIQAPFTNLKSGTYFTSIGMGCHRYVHSGKLSVSAIESGKEILRELYLAGHYLHHHPDFIERLQKYIARFEKQAKAIQKERKRLLGELNKGELSQREYARQEHEQLLAERRNVMERGIVFRRYAEELALQSGGRADISSVLRFNLPLETSLVTPTQ